MLKASDLIISEMFASGGSSPALQDKSITANGTYTADEGYDGIGTATVNVSGGSAPTGPYVEVGTLNDYFISNTFHNFAGKQIGNYSLIMSNLRPSVFEIYFKDTPASITQNAFSQLNVNNVTIRMYVPWAQGAVVNFPWGANAGNTTITYNYAG